MLTFLVRYLSQDKLKMFGMYEKNCQQQRNTHFSYLISSFVVVVVWGAVYALE